VIVAFTVSCLRQEYLRKSLDSWARVRGIRDCKLVFVLEPPGGLFPLASFEEFLQRSFPGRWTVHAAEAPLGCLKNTRRAMELALAEEDFGVVAEEDVEVADDVLEYFSWARDAYRGNGVQAVCSHARASELVDAAATTRASWFNPLVWGTWLDRWENVFAPQWGPVTPSAPESWDTKFMTLFRQSGQCCLFPAQSRSVHQGEVSTMYSYEAGKALWPKTVSSCYTAHYDPQNYREVEFPAAPGVLVI
jgi:hypothetical protein